MDPLVSYITAFNRDVDSALVQLCGIKFTDTAPGLDHDNDLLAEYIRASKTPAEFADALRRRNGLVLVAHRGAEYASGYNGWMAAVLEFARNAEGWYVGDDQRAYTNRDGKTLKLSFADGRVQKPDGTSSKEWAFLLLEADTYIDLESLPQDEFGRISVPDDLDFRLVAFRADIVDILQSGLYDHLTVDDAPQPVGSLSPR